MTNCFAMLASGSAWLAGSLGLLLALTLGLLLAVLRSERVWRRVRPWVCRQGPPPLHDWRGVWRSFTQATVQHLDTPELGRAIVQLVAELLQSLSVTLWLADDRKESLVFAASTALTKAEAGQLKLEAAEITQLIGTLDPQSAPLDLEGCEQSWARRLRQVHRCEWSEQDLCLCAPLMLREEFLGVLVLGERASGGRYGPADLELLKTVSDQAAATLLNLRLAQKLTQAKQLEAFQTMSTFFAHDLKNTASTLSLMLRNLPVHFNDPGFREDALRGIAHTVSHLNDLIGRLRLLREELVLHPVDADLNELVAEALQGLEQAPQGELVKELKPLPKVRVDPGQIRAVVTNLVLNAKEAIGTGGRIRVATQQQPGWAILAVADSGCGMSADFIQRGLFRPFQTTKKNGIGIGMFQCKLIVEAHRGKIEVESQPGQGTAFRVWLPLAQA